MQVVFFDIDGVLVRECGVAERGYAFALMVLSSSWNGPESQLEGPADARLSRSDNNKILGAIATVLDGRFLNDT